MATNDAKLLAFDEAPCAFDRESVRSYDRDGRLHVASTNISKATINEYFGREIPQAQALGLDPDRKYRMLRDPKELERSASTFNNLQLLSRHVAVSARDHQPDLVIGSTGTDAVFEHPYLRNSLVLWANDGIHDVEAALKRELSCSYHYDADMTPGRYEDQPYDGVMRNIVGNHVALVKAGRAGPDVVVGDEKPTETLTMSTTVLTRKAALVQGAVIGYLAPKLAKDEKLADLTALFAPVKADNYVASKAAIIAGLTKQTTGKLAKDAKLDDLPAFLGAFDAMDPAEEADDSEEDDEEEKKKKAAADKKARDKKAKDAKAAKDAEEEEERKKADDADCDTPEKKAAADKKRAYDKAAKDKAAKDAEESEKEKEKAMDEAIKLAKDEAIAEGAKQGVKLAHEIRDAERFARAYVGEMPGVAFDSAEQVYRAALKIKGVKDAEKIHVSALRTVLEAQPVMNRATPRVAMDAASVSSFDKMFPSAARIGRA